MNETTKSESDKILAKIKENEAKMKETEAKIEETRKLLKMIESIQRETRFLGYLFGIIAGVLLGIFGNLWASWFFDTYRNEAWMPLLADSSLGFIIGVMIMFAYWVLKLFSSIKKLELMATKAKEDVKP